MAPEDTRTDSDSWRGSHLVCNDATPRRLPRNEMEDGRRHAPGLERSLFMVGESVVLIFRVPNSNSADARDGILLPVVMDH